MLTFWTSPKLTLQSLELAVTRFTPYELQLKNPVLDWSPFEFHADLVLINYRDLQSPPLVALQAVNLAMSPRELLTGHITRGQFTASNVTYYLDEQSSDEPIDMEALLAPLSRLPRQIDVGSLHLISRADNIWIFPLVDLSATKNDDGAWTIGAEAAIARRSVSLAAQADWRILNPHTHRLDVTATISGLEEDSQLRASGYVDAAGAQLNYQLGVKGRYERVGDFLRALDAQAYPFGGNLSIEGTLSGDLRGYELTLDELRLVEGDAYSFSASGTMVRRDNAEVSLNLTATGFTREMEGIIPADHTLADLLLRSELELNVTGTLAAPELERTSLILHGVGGTRVSLSSQAQTLQLSQLSTFSQEQTVNADLEGSVSDLGGLLLASGVTNTIVDSQLANVAATFSGEAHGTLDELRVELHKLEAAHPRYTLSGKASLLWRQTLLSAPVLELALSHKSGNGTISASGSIAELGRARGLALNLNMNDLAIAPLLTIFEVTPPFALHRINGTALLTRASDTVRLQDLDLQLEPLPGSNLHITGSGAVLEHEITADLDLDLTRLEPDTWQKTSSLIKVPESFHASLRLRPAYATLLSDTTVGDTRIQGVATADLDRYKLDRLSVDLYSARLHIDDFIKSSSGDKGITTDEPWDIQPLAQRIPDFPVQLSLRSGQVTGPLSRLADLSLAIDTVPGRITLRELDTRYAGGELMLRGNVDYQVSPPALSLAGRGIRVPLGALTEDLGIQQNVSGAMSFQGGLLTRGTVQGDWRSHLQGRVSTAFNDVTVSGAAYDLLMSNLLAWLVSGAGEKTTTFSCSMAQFDIAAGVAHSDSIYIETPRMLATGKASVDLPQNHLDVRIEPRSKTRAFQFPSAVHLEGPLADPRLRVSPLQASADLSAQALLLLPGLTLKLFGLAGPDNPYRPCETGSP
ncbi:hypothetical protein NOR53_2303 [gamma proteobacterium NOR5-3]|nr:hypothetical protein NOR53_2303 [gamma proteobacterium NOR5-3]